VLSTASLMVGGAAAADAVARTRRLPELRVGLHLNLIDGRPVLPEVEIRRLVRGTGEFDPNMVRAGIRFWVFPGVRRQLGSEIRAQFAAFQATGLPLDHVNAHKHMHLHPCVAELIIEIGRDYGMKAVRVPSEPIAVLRRAFPDEHFRTPPYRPWVVALRRLLQRAGLRTNDHLFGLAWSGRMVEARILGLLPYLPDGVSEIYFHPAAERTPTLVPAIRGYRRAEELATLLSPLLRDRIAHSGIRLVSYSDL
jgi:hopanoid biosynthesis associated protein HpnK